MQSINTVISSRTILLSSFSYHGNPRFSGWDSNPNHFGLTLAIILIATVFATSFAIDKKKSGTAIVLFLVAIAATHCLGESYSRGAWFTYLLSLICIFCFGKTNSIISGKAVWTPLIFVLCFLIKVFHMQSGFTRIASAIEVNDGSFANRVAFLVQGSSFILDHPNGFMGKNALAGIFGTIYSPIFSPTWTDTFKITNLVNTPISLIYIFGLWIGGLLITFYLVIWIRPVFSKKNQLLVQDLIFFIFGLCLFIGSFFLWFPQSIVLSLTYAIYCSASLMYYSKTQIKWNIYVYTTFIVYPVVLLAILLALKLLAFQSFFRVNRHVIDNYRNISCINYEITASDATHNLSNVLIAQSSKWEHQKRTKAVIRENFDKGRSLSIILLEEDIVNNLKKIEVSLSNYLQAEHPDGAILIGSGFEGYLLILAFIKQIYMLDTNWHKVKLIRLYDTNVRYEVKNFPSIQSSLSELTGDLNRRTLPKLEFIYTDGHSEFEQIYAKDFLNLWSQNF